MRIAFLLDRFPVLSETFIVRQIIGLLDRGHEVDIFANARGEDAEPIQPDVVRYDLLARTTYISVPAASGTWEMPVWPLTDDTWLPGEAKPIRNVSRVLRALPVIVRCLRLAPRVTRQVLSPREFGIQARSLSALYRLAALLQERRAYDVIHAHFGPVGLMYRFASALWNAPLIVSIHGYDFSTWPRRHGRNAYGPLFRTATFVTVNSEFTRAAVEALGCEAGKLRLLPVGLDPASFPFRPRALAASGAIRLLSVGRLVTVKGHEYGIRAVAKLLNKYPRLKYDIVGSGPLRDQLLALANELGVQEAVTLHGARDTAYVRHMMDAADVFLMPSVSVDGATEGQGLAVQEAQAAGLPVIVTNHGALPEGMIPGRSGLVAIEGNVDSLADAVDSMVQRSDDWTVMGQCGRSFVTDRYDIDKLNAALVSTYHDARSLYDTQKKSSQTYAAAAG